jgi:hypothetical protein
MAFGLGPEAAEVDTVAMDPQSPGQAGTTQIEITPSVSIVRLRVHGKNQPAQRQSPSDDVLLKAAM